ncbi:MAG: hypothetical protein KA954_11910 [Chitinophagales bacterium]|nr:hypothetical protein [Chitinophagales bacterium]MBP8753259.1 hypothetical protein [Chitinophagales bacterium]MBP9189379.1 hypothetical protein [Chitinophagales bacterium]MBP9548403.1 hypothetical protein [Chitinophagales bacterium]MBP9703467.1 hypothetical protein [Chitinophagales bacterium]
MYKIILIISVVTTFIFSSCDKDIKHFSTVDFKSIFDKTQVRLDKDGNPVTLPAGNAAQSPRINELSIHYLELSQDEFTPYKKGAQLYKSAETIDGGAVAIDFDSAIIVSENEISFTVNINRIANDNYNYVRASVSYLNYDIDLILRNIPSVGDVETTGTVASFIGYNTYIRTLQIMQLSTDINANKSQGFWAFETHLTAPYESYNSTYSGQSIGITTCVNPIAATSPLPLGSGVITGKFTEPLVIDDESKKQNLTITLSFSNNNSFEWEDVNANGIWDVDVVNPALTEQVVDMGLRGMIATFHFTE